MNSVCRGVVLHACSYSWGQVVFPACHTHSDNFILFLLSKRDWFTTTLRKLTTFLYANTIVYSSSGVVEVNSCRIPLLACIIITCLWSHVNAYLPIVYPCILAGKVEEVLLCLLYCICSWQCRVKSTSKSIINNSSDYFDWQSKKLNSTPPKWRLMKPLASQNTL